MNQRDQQILGIALPAIVTNITVPLLGLVDTAIVGHMGDAAYIGAIAVGSMIFSLVYWVFAFLRMGTSGMTAQARGRRDMQDVMRLLTRSLTVSLVISLSVIVLQYPLREVMLWFIGPTADVRSLAITYFNIVVWGAPAVLGLYSLSGWYIGMQNSRTPMWISIMQNVVNILASLLLVYGMGMKVEGVALGTVIAQYAGLLVAIVLWLRYYRRLLRWRVSLLKDQLGDWLAFFRVNRDIFLRTVFLVAVNLYFTSAGARQGAVILAVNTLLMQLYLFFSYFMDGFAYAGEALGGRYWGARNIEAYRDVVRHLFGWGTAMVILFTVVYVIGGMPFLRLLTDEPHVVEASREYVWWAYLIPIAGVAAFVWDGIFIGITATRGMLVSSLIAAVVFFMGVMGLMDLMGNHGLWLAMVLYLATRGIIQTILYQQNNPKSR
ncbi:MAG: MATE family efflux transporter [Prevotella sp.]|nr:MATE family efflux transporter [Prevotella sp.]